MADIPQVREAGAITDVLDEYRTSRDAAFREAQRLVDEAFLLEQEARNRREQAAHTLSELEEGGQQARGLLARLGLKISP